MSEDNKSIEQLREEYKYTHPADNDEQQAVKYLRRRSWKEDQYKKEGKTFIPCETRPIKWVWSK